MTYLNIGQSLKFMTAGLLTAAALFMTGKPLWAGEDALRVVAVGGSVTEIVYALGEEDRLVARDTTSVFPEEAQDLPDVGYIRALSPEGVLSVDPDLVLMLDGSGPQEAVDVLKKTGLPIADIPNSFTPEGIVEKVRAVGEALGVPDKAAALIVAMEAGLDAAARDANAGSPEIRVLFVLSTAGGRIMASGSGTAAHGILQLAGATNAVAAFSGYKQLSDEALLSAAPDVVLMMDREGDHAASADELFSHPALSQTPAGKNNRLIKMDGQYLLGFGPRTADAIRDLAAELKAFRS
ncbi:hemin ABC transporter substrate-binding protein [Roseibium denhamense]|uniref:Iron complex transport system substrate-binding protein n=1 Tax=Roseibium denhamense TaxID=76305 RepID=A0ABY1P5M3_9HYPH|nr:ABC transporter substrate-binding protein [Roseibium denhamense]MTI07147.1 hemin ABC transporter substrate-binding protein [Roseibium denhamense]SMP26846.1 iron complex transport system substrate-binding protein [Roseibium denhamense]